MTTTANMITILSTPKETLLNAIKRSINNAQCNNLSVKLVFNGVTSIVSQDDSYKTHLKAMKIELCKQELSELRG